MSSERINPTQLARPAGYSHAVVATGSRTVYLAGQTALDSTGVILGNNIVDQFELALSNLLTALSATGGDPSHLVRMTCYLTDIDDYRQHSGEIGQVWRRLAGRDYPAMAAIEVTSLWDSTALVELDGIAVLP